MIALLLPSVQIIPTRVLIFSPQKKQSSVVFKGGFKEINMDRLFKIAVLRNQV